MYDVFAGHMIVFSSDGTSHCRTDPGLRKPLISYEATIMYDPSQIGFRIMEKQYAYKVWFDPLDPMSMWLIQCDTNSGEVARTVPKVFMMRDGVFPVVSRIGWCETPAREVKLDLRRNKKRQCLDMEIQPSGLHTPVEVVIWVTDPVKKRTRPVPYLELLAARPRDYMLEGPGEPSENRPGPGVIRRPVPGYDDVHDASRTKVLAIEDQNTGHWAGMFLVPSVLQLCAIGTLLDEFIMHMSWTVLDSKEQP